jgi:hypothetical protein
VVDERPQRVEPEPALERRRRTLLVAVRGHQGGVHINDERIVGRGVVVGGVLAGQRPYPGPSGSPGGVDRRQGTLGVAGQHIHRPRDRRVRGDVAEQARLGAQHRHVGQAVPSEGEADRQIAHDLARMMCRQRLVPRLQRLCQQPVQPGSTDRLGQQQPARMGHDTRARRIHHSAWVEPDSVHLESAPRLRAL